MAKGITKGERSLVVKGIRKRSQGRKDGWQRKDGKERKYDLLRGWSMSEEEGS